MDTSQISAIDLGLWLDSYKVNSQQTNTLSNIDNKRDFFQCEIVQSREQVTYQWSQATFDLILGLVGGFTSLIWAFLGCMIQPFEDFKFQSTLIGEMYSTSPQPDQYDRKNPSNPEIQTPEAARNHLFNTVIEKGKFYYPYY